MLCWKLLKIFLVVIKQDNTMDLYLFPQSATNMCGYRIGVKYAFNRLQPTKDDLVIWYTNDKIDPNRRKEDIVIPRVGMGSIKQIKNILLNHPRTEVNLSDLSFLKGKHFDHIHCDDVLFYRSIRSLFPSQKIDLRFHNCFTRILDRKHVLGMSLNLRFEFSLMEYKQLEREIFRDKNVYKIFISNEDRDYYTMMTGQNDCCTWTYQLNEEKAKANRSEFAFENKLVWFGGVESHKFVSVRWFVNEVFGKLRLVIPDIEFHLWGSGTEQFNDEVKGIFGHGIYENSDMPLKGKALYVNPDIIGGGVKLKIQSYYENGIPFITTPFGYEGYSKDIIDNKYCSVIPMNDWVDKIVLLLKDYKG